MRGRRSASRGHQRVTRRPGPATCGSSSSTVCSSRTRCPHDAEPVVVEPAELQVGASLPRRRAWSAAGARPPRSGPSSRRSRQQRRNIGSGTSRSPRNSSMRVVSPGGAALLELHHVVAIHRQDQVAAGEVGRADLAAAKLTEIVARAEQATRWCADRRVADRACPLSPARAERHRATRRAGLCQPSSGKRPLPPGIGSSSRHPRKEFYPVSPVSCSQAATAASSTIQPRATVPADVPVAHPLVAARNSAALTWRGHVHDTAAAVKPAAPAPRGWPRQSRVARASVRNPSMNHRLRSSRATRTRTMPIQSYQPPTVRSSVSDDFANSNLNLWKPDRLHIVSLATLLWPPPTIAPLQHYYSCHSTASECAQVARRNVRTTTSGSEHLVYSTFSADQSRLPGADSQQPCRLP